MFGSAQFGKYPHRHHPRNIVRELSVTVIQFKTAVFFNDNVSRRQVRRVLRYQHICHIDSFGQFFTVVEENIILSVAAGNQQKISADFRPFGKFRQFAAAGIDNAIVDKKTAGFQKLRQTDPERRLF